MKARTIKLVLHNKVKAWLESLPEGMRKEVGDATIVTGGSIVSMLLGEKINDLDIYFNNLDVVRKVAHHYVCQFKQTRNGLPIHVVEEKGRIKIKVQSAGVAGEQEEGYQYFEMAPDATAETDVEEYVEQAMEIAKEEGEKPKYRPVFLSQNAITLSQGIQIVIRFYGDADKIHENYDFVHCTNFYEYKGNKLTLRPKALETILAKELRYVGSKYPLCSIIRTRKFVERGWRINAGQFVKMALQISDLNLTDFATLEDQLTGVDTAYFLELIRLLKEKDPEMVDRSYLLELIDRMF